MTDDSGSEERQRRIARTVRFTGIEDAVIRVRADAAGVPVATYVRCAALDFPIPREARGPTVDHKAASQLLGYLGRAATAFSTAAELIDPKLAEETARGMNESRLILFRAMGLKP